MLDPGKIPPSKMNLGIFHNLGKTTPHPIKTSIILKVPTSSTLPPNYSIRAKGSTSQSLYFETWAEKPFFGARAAWKSWFSLFFSDFHQNAHPGWSPTRNWEIQQRNRNWIGVGSNDRSFHASSRKNPPVENELGNFSILENYPSPHKKFNYFNGSN